MQLQVWQKPPCLMSRLPSLRTHSCKFDKNTRFWCQDFRHIYSLQYFDLFAYRHKIQPQTIRWHRCLRWLGDFGWANSPGRCSENDRFPRMKYTSNLSYHFKDHELLSITSIFTIVENVICILYLVLLSCSTVNDITFIPEWFNSSLEVAEFLVTSSYSQNDWNPLWPLGYFPKKTGWSTNPRGKTSKNGNESFWWESKDLSFRDDEPPWSLNNPLLSKALFSWVEWHWGGGTLRFSWFFVGHVYFTPKKSRKKSPGSRCHHFKGWWNSFWKIFFTLLKE